MRFVPETNTRMWSGIPRLYYKGFAGSKVPVQIKWVKGGKK